MFDRVRGWPRETHSSASRCADQRSRRRYNATWRPTTAVYRALHAPWVSAGAGEAPSSVTHNTIAAPFVLTQPFVAYSGYVRSQHNWGGPS